jgi:single-strand DNA-binding protein
MMNDLNVVALIGRVTKEPVVRDLPGGSTVTQVEVATNVDGVSTTIPVALHERSITVGVDEHVLVVGQVQRRFFRAGGSTQSRTEVVARHVIPTRRRATVSKLLAGTFQLLTDAD